MNVSPDSSPKSLLSKIKTDLLPSVAVFLVALPLCLGIAIASGVPVAAGLITGIVGGLIVGFLAGSPLQVSGPAAGLTVIVYGIVQQFGFEALGIIVLGAGLLQVLAGLLRLGQWFRAVSPAVIQGMLAGIGLLILASQFHVMVDDKPKESGIQNLLTIPQAIAKGLPLPEPSTIEQRQFRTELLKQVGDLHERQSEIHDAIAAAVPANAPKEGTVHIATDVAGLIAEQEKIIAELREVAQRIESTQLSKSDNTDGDEAKRAVVLAVERGEEALAQLRADAGSNARETQQTATNSLQTLLASLKSHEWAAKIGLITIAVLLLWQGFAPKRLKVVPAPLVAITVATAIAFIWSLPVLYVEVPDSLLSSIHLPSLTVLQGLPLLGLIQASVVVALIASAETLLCATAVDQMHRGQRTDYDRELFAQGVGNSVCGLLGALPMTGVIVRSAANIQAGAQSRFSSIMHGLWLLVFVGLLGSMIRSIPVASLAAVLVYTGYKLLNLKQLKELRKYGWGEVAIFLATLIGIVTTDLLHGVLIGIALSAAKLLYTFSHLKTYLHVDCPSNRTVLSLEGTATFLRLPLLAATLEKVPANAELHVDLQRLDYIDHACLDLLMNWAKQHEASGGSLVIDWNSLHAQFHGEAQSRHRSVA